jgi:hypothetical protein
MAIDAYLVFNKILIKTIIKKQFRPPPAASYQNQTAGSGVNRDKLVSRRQLRPDLINQKIRTSLTHEKLKLNFQESC